MNPHKEMLSYCRLDGAVLQPPPPACLLLSLSAQRGETPTSDVPSLFSAGRKEYKYHRTSGTKLNWLHSNITPRTVGFPLLFAVLPAGLALEAVSLCAVDLWLLLAARCSSMG